MRIQQTILWTGISVMTGAICLGAAEPKHSKVGPGVPSVDARYGLDGAPMVLIPAGPFTMESDDGPQNERPAHTVTLDAYSIDRYKVTLASIENFWKKGNLTRLRHGTMRPQRRSEIVRQSGCDGNRQSPIVDGPGNDFRRRLSGRGRLGEPMGVGIRGERCSRSSILQTITEVSGSVKRSRSWRSQAVSRA